MSDLADKRVLITGGLGFIGSNLAQECCRQGARVTLFDCLDPRSGGNMCNVADIRDDVDLVLDDIRNFESVCQAVVGQDIVYNCAAYTSHPQSMKDPHVDIDVNCKGTVNILEAVRRFSPDSRLIHVGTSTQVGRMVHDLVDELHPEFPRDIYSANKVAAEKYVLIYSHVYGIHGSVVRLGNVYGPRSNIRSADFGFMNFFIGLALKGMPLTVFGRGQQIRNVTYVGDGVSALLSSIQVSASGEAFFAVSDVQLTIMEIAREIVDTIGGEVKQVPWPQDRAAIEIGDAVVSNGKIRERLGWRPQWGLREGLEATRDYYLPRLDAYLS